jgi:hypothetical protein
MDLESKSPDRADQAHRARAAHPVFIFGYGAWRVYDGGHCSIKASQTKDIAKAKRMARELKRAKPRADQ